MYVTLGIATDSFAAGTSNNSLDVTLTNNTAAAVSIAGFNFEINAASGSGLTFSDAFNTGVSNPYIFAGNSSTGPPGTSISTGVSNGGLTIDANDNVNTPNSSTSVGVGQTVSLGNVLFALSAGSTSPIAITFTTMDQGTSLSDARGGNVNFTTAAGSHVGPTAVPELSTPVLIVAALVVVVAVRLRGRVRQIPQLLKRSG